MKSTTVTLIALLSINLFCYSQVIELPLNTHNGYGHFSTGFGGVRSFSVDDDNPLNPKITKFPEGLSDMKYGYIETNRNQSIYQEYLLGNVSKSLIENSMIDTLNLSNIPIKTKIVFAYGKDSEGTLKVVVDANNNLDLSDDKAFTPLNAGSFDRTKEDSIAQAYAINVSFETYKHNEIVPVSVPLLIYYAWGVNKSVVLMYSFLQYLTTQFKEEQIAVSSGNFTDLSYNEVGVAFFNDLKDGEKVKKEEIYRKNEYIEIKNEIYKIIGVNINKNTLILEKTDLPKSQLFSSQIGYKSFLFQDNEFTTGSTISLEDFKGKYVLLDFWAEWCGPCIREFPNLKELYSKTDREKFEIIGIIGASKYEGVQKLIDQHSITWPQLLSDKIVGMYGVNTFPTKIILDTEGKVISKELRGKALEEKILSLINE